jgi:hypothetical protein
MDTNQQETHTSSVDKYIYPPIEVNKIEKRISKRSTFVHITKTGGTAVEKYFCRHYFQYIRGRGHRNICKSLNHPIVIIREPISRFESMYHYWKRGSVSGDFMRDESFIDKYIGCDVKSFIHKIKTNVKDLKYKFTWREHFKKQTAWIPENCYKNTIVIKYVDDLNDSIHKLLEHLKIPDLMIPLEKENVSKKEETIILDVDDIENIKEIYKEDFELWDKIENQPELFLFVI